MDRWTKKEETKQLKKSGAVKATKKTTTKKTVTAEKKAAAPVEAPVAVKGNAFGVIIKPLVTEKSAIMQSVNKFSFMVARDAKKSQIKRAVKELYNVDARQINIINVQGRAVRFGRSQGRRSDFKKAIVTLPQGQSITIHEGV